MSHYSEKLICELENICRQLRVTSLEMIHSRGAGHPGGSLSAAEIITALYFCKMKIDATYPNSPHRDRFILSKGHASAILYSALARRKFFPESDLKLWGKLECHLQGHPDRCKTPGIDMTTGVLGHGIAVGAGLALAARLNNQQYRIYVLLGDGECQAGIVWEGAMLAGKYGLSNLTIIIDYNDVQLDGFVHNIMPLEPFKMKLSAFNLKVLEIDGHNLRHILEALDEAERIHNQTSVILAHTTKGKGVDFMENKSEWHGLVPQRAELELAKKAILEES